MKASIIFLGHGDWRFWNGDRVAVAVDRGGGVRRQRRRLSRHGEGASEGALEGGLAQAGDQAGNEFRFSVSSIIDRVTTRAVQIGANF